MFSELSKNLTKQLSQKVKKENGIYFTNKDIILRALQYIDLNNIKYILEPSCGSCEFINYIDKSYSNKEIDGIELNKTIFDEIIKIEYKNKVNFTNSNFITHKFNKKYDLIIGNPPYFVIKKDLYSEYQNYITGRPNIYTLFIEKSLSLLNDVGILCFVLPKNFLNCMYYNNLRKIINEKYKIINIIDCSKNKYLETNQDTIILIIQNSDNNDNDKFILNEAFNTEETIILLKEFLKDYTTLSNLNCEVSIGSIVWNQHKEILTNDNTETRLIYSTDLSISKFKNDKKKNFIKMPGINKKLIIVNRGYGVGKYKFSYCLIDVEYNFLIENHLIVIYNEDSEVYDKIIKSFENEKTKKFIELYFGNNSINSTELLNILPIFNI